MKTTTAILAASAAICLVGGSAAAEPLDNVRLTTDPDKVSVVVRYHELDLMREEGARALIGRIKQAAKTVCGPQPARISLDMYAAYQTCVSHSASTAVRKVDVPLVTALYGGKLVLLAGS